MPTHPTTVTRAQVVAEARSWIGTPYHHNQIVKGPAGGVDCAMLMAGVYGNVGYLPSFDVRHYPPDWFLNHRAERYLAVVTEHAREITEAEAGPGDVILFCLGKDQTRYAHGAIVDADGLPHMIHAHSVAGMVMPDIAGQGKLRDLPRRYFTIWD